MKRLAIIAAIAVASGCSCRCDLAVSSSSKSTNDPDHPTAPLSIVAVGHDAAYALVAVDNTQIAVLSPAGAVLSHVKLSDARQATARDHGSTIVVIDGDDVHAIDLRTGTELWKRRYDGIGDMTFGGDRVAVVYHGGVAIVDLPSGREIYQRTGAAGRAARHYDQVGFVLADDQHAWLVGDDLADHWSIDLPPDTGLVTAGPDLVVTIRKQGDYVANDPRTGSEVARGRCSNGRATEVTLRRRAADAEPGRSVSLCTDDPPDGDLLAVDADRRALYVVGSRIDPHAKLELVAYDAIGRVRWKAPWPGLDRTIMLADRDDGDVAAFVKHDGTVLVYDVDAGKPLFEHRLTAGDRYVGFTGDCLLISTRRAAVCLDRHTGEQRWTTPTSGRSAAIWPLATGESLLADGNPITLSKLDVSGRRTWQIPIPDDPVLTIPADVAAWPVLTTEPDDHAPATTPWVFSSTTGVQISGPAARVLDARAGVVREIRP